MNALGVILLLAIATGDDWPYPFAPFDDANHAASATRFERHFKSTAGVRGALRALCTDPYAHRRPGPITPADDAVYEQNFVEDLVAKNFLIERADRSIPILLDTIRKGDHPKSSEAAHECKFQAFSVTRTALCFGYDAGGSGDTWDAHPLAVERRARALRTFAGVLAAGGPRADVALDLLAEDTGICTGLPEMVRATTPTLVKLLGAPRPPVRIPVHPHSATATWDVAFRVLSFGGADRALAEQPVAAFLDHDASAPLAALAIARMGADATAALPRIARVIEGIQVKDDAQLMQLSDAVAALIAIGKPARIVLPSLGKLLSRPDAPGCHSLGGRRYAELVRTIATPADGEQAAAVLAPLIRCNRAAMLTTTEGPVVEALGELGLPARSALLEMFRDDTRLAAERLSVLALLRKLSDPGLDERDRRLATLLERKRATPPAGLKAPPRLPAALAACRAEAGLPPRPADGPPIVPPARDHSKNGFASCLEMHLCGPGRETFALTMRRCCQDAYGNNRPPYCEVEAGPRDR